MVTHNKTAAQLAAEWRAHAAALRNRAVLHQTVELGWSPIGESLMAKADAYDECARQLMTDLHGMGVTR